MSDKRIIAIIGAGASGLVAAIESARILNGTGGNFSVIVFERLSRVGKKILATGNGRCNLSNTDLASVHYHGDIDFAMSALNIFNTQQTIDFFKSIGVLTAVENGRIYPISFSANAVLDCLRFEANRLGVDFLCDTPINSIKKTNNGFLINNNIKADRVIIATGGKSASVHGSNGSGYQLLNQLGHSITPTLPALVQLVSSSEYSKQLKGVRVSGSITIKEDEVAIKSEYGEILFTDYGLSGIATMQVARYVGKTLKNKSNAKLIACLDMAHNLSLSEICEYIGERKVINKTLECENLLIGILPKRVAQAVLKNCNISPQSREIQTLTQNEIKKIASCIKCFEMKITGTKDFDASQVTAGGAVTNEFEPVSFKSKKVDGLFACGEVLDVDADCGGYNLQWAWCSGYLAGKNCSEEILNVKNK
ncbi:MAG: NAD(P)/FAD-dependent oxidoreductase [Clostridia bacterium]|nr:NAD(P)/FAD-dependent oxidoreductase [Clostridia bacterium]